MTKSIPLSGKRGQGLFTLVDDQDYDELAQWSWSVTANGYVSRSVHIRLGLRRYTSQGVLMHRSILNAPDGTQVDHVSGNRLDNRRANLRITDAIGNQRNRRKGEGGSSKFKGVTRAFDQQKWASQIHPLSVNLHLGYYEDERIAALAYDRAAREHFGEFAWLNFPDNYDYTEIPPFPVKAKSGYRGVYWHRGNQIWHARIHHKGRTISLGYHHDAMRAARAYDAAARRLRGVRARPNFLEDTPLD